MATLPNLNKAVVKDPNPPVNDLEVSPITIPDGTTLVTTKTTNETIDNVNQIIDYISGDDALNFIPQLAIDNLVSDLAGKEPSLGFTPEDSANKGAISGYAGLDGSQELLLANFPSGNALQVLRRDAANTALEFVDPTVGAGIASINADTTAAQIIAVGNGLNIIDAGATHTLSIDLTVVTVTGVQTLTNKTITAAANTLTIASTDLTDTGDLVRNNTENNYTSGAKQTFSHTGFLAGIRIAGSSGNPATLVDGDIWLNTSTNTLFARINAVNVDLGVGSGITSINADTTAAQIIAGTTNRISLVDAGDTHTFDIDASYVGQSSITTLGTITIGVWNGTAITGGNINAASTDLTDTGLLVRINDDNIYGAGFKQTFSHSGFLAGIRIAGNVGDPSILVDGDIWLNTSTNTLFARINAVNVDLGVGSGITSINADTTAAQIIAAGTGLSIVDAGATHTLSIDLTVVTVTGVQTLTNKTLIDPTIASFVNATHNHQAAAGGGTLVVTAITDFDTEVTANAAVTANTAKITNATHTGDVTGSVALTIANGAVDIVMLSASGTPDGTTFLRGDNTWAVPAGGGDMVLADAQTNTGIKTFEDTTMKLRNVADTFDGFFVNTNTADRIYTLPNAAGTIALTSDLSGFFDTAGTGLTSSGSTVNVIGTTNRIDANANDIDISASYVGQTSITTLGTIATGTWEGTTIAVNQGGTGVTSSTGTINVVLSNSPTLVTPALGTPSALVGTNITGTASGLTAGNVTTNANLTGPITSVGNATTIIAKAVTVAMLADGTDGELITWDSLGVAAVVAVGTVGQVLTSGGVGVAPTFQDAAGGTTFIGFTADDNLEMGAFDIQLETMQQIQIGDVNTFITTDATQNMNFDIAINKAFEFNVSGANVLTVGAGSTVFGAPGTNMSGLNRLDFIEISPPPDPGPDVGRLFVADVSGDSHIFFKNTTDHSGGLDLTLGGTTFIGFTADDNLEMGAFDIQLETMQQIQIGDVDTFITTDVAQNMNFDIAINKAFEFNINSTNVLTVAAGSVIFGGTNMSGLNQLDFTEVVAPSPPGLNVGRLYVADVSGDSHIFFKNSTDHSGGIDLTLGGSISFIGFTADADLDMGAFDINLDASQVISFDGATEAQTISGDAGGINFNIPTSDQYTWFINSVQEMNLTATSLNMASGQNIVLLGATLQLFDSSTSVGGDTNGLILNNALGDALRVRVDSTNEYIFDAAQADWLTNDLVNLGNVTFADAKDIIINTTTGTKIGTATGQKIGFWNATPIVQPPHIANAAANIGSLTMAVNGILGQLADMGLQASS